MTLKIIIFLLFFFIIISKLQEEKIYEEYMAATNCALLGLFPPDKEACWAHNPEVCQNHALLLLKTMID